MGMDGMDGVQAARWIRNPNSPVLNHEIPFLAMTANVQQSDRVICLDAGMNEFIPKPVSPLALRAALAEWLPGLRRRRPEYGCRQIGHIGSTVH